MPRITDLSDARLDLARASSHAAPPAHASGQPVKGRPWLDKLRLVNAILSIEEPSSIDVSASPPSPSEEGK